MNDKKIGLQKNRHEPVYFVLDVSTSFPKEFHTLAVIFACLIMDLT